MIEKMSLEQFEQIKNQLANLIKQYEEYDELHQDDENYNSDEIDEKFIEQYFSIQNRLLSYDLSDIPFEAWEDFEICSDENHIADFSKTRANIDFGLIEYEGNANFRGCNVRNLEAISGTLNGSDFDEETIKANPLIFLSDIFSEEFKDKYYSGVLTVQDLASLSDQQLQEIKNHRSLKFRIVYQDLQLLETLGIDKVVALYRYSPEEYDVVNKLMYSSINHRMIGSAFSSKDEPSVKEFLEKIKTVEISELKNTFFDFVRKQILTSSLKLYKDNYPEMFIKENPDIFLVGVDIPEEVKERYFDRNLQIQDLIDYPEVFKNIPIDYFMAFDTYIPAFIRDNYGMGRFQELLQKHPDVFAHIAQEEDFYSFQQLLKKGKDLESTFREAVKEYFLESYRPKQFRVIRDGQTIYNVPDWVASMNFTVIDELNTPEDLLACTDSVVVLNSKQRRTLELLNIDNIQRFERETGFFSHKGSSRGLENLEMLTAFSRFFDMYGTSSLANMGIVFKNGCLSYEEFLNQLAKCLDIMRKNEFFFMNFTNYDWLQGEFRNKHPEIFIDLNAPDDLKKAYYSGQINVEFLFEHQEYMPYLIDKNLFNTLKVTIKLNLPGLIDAQGHIMPTTVNFMDEYVSRYGNEKLLKLISKYGALVSDITISSIHNEIEDEQAIEKSLRNAIYNKIIKGKMNYAYLANIPEMVREYPEIFVNFDELTSIPQAERQRLTDAFYSRHLNFGDIQKYPELIPILIDKNLFIAFGNKDGTHYDGRIILNAGYNSRGNKYYSDLELLDVLGNEQFLQLCSIYGRYLNGTVQHLNQYITIKDGKYIDLSNENLDGLKIEEISKIIEDIIIRESKLGNIDYLPDDAPRFLRERNPELFLSDDAPEELKKYFYNYNRNSPLTFAILQAHKEWLPYLKGKALTTALLRNDYLKPDLIKFIEVFGEETAIKLGINRPETVIEMMKAHQVDLMKSWYDKTGGKFIPDFVVMQNFNIEEADKFLASGANWSNLMRIQSFSKTSDARDAMLKLAYSFGAFDQDQRGFKKLQELLTGLPKKIDLERAYIFELIDQQINRHSQRGVFFGVNSRSFMDSQGNVHTTRESFPSSKVEESYQNMIEYVKNHPFIDLLDTQSLLNLLEALKKENVGIDFSRNIFTQIYRKNEDGSYSLTINPQSCPKSAQAIRDILERCRGIPIITPEKAHRLFGGFKMQYDPEFREFFLANFDKIMRDSEYSLDIVSIQRRFQEIKIIFKNVPLTLDLVVSYIHDNRYENVDVGNEEIPKIAAINEYSQEDFEILQEIYNYGKQRTFSSIPRIEGEHGKYTYQLLRLDDPLAMAVGKLSTCCQRLGEPAELCMEHSMVDKNGRVFVIFNEKGELVAQSWVWRNRDVLCFDNIEVPDKQMWDHGISRGEEDLGIRNDFTDEILEIYKKAAHELIIADEKVYSSLLKEGKISQEQYDGLRLGKITTGEGYSNIKGSLQTLESDRSEHLARPLPFVEPVKLNRGLYTNDSAITQYILEEREDRKPYDGETLAVHSDSYVEYDDSTFNENLLLRLERLEAVTKENTQYLETKISKDADKKHLVTELAENYNLNPDTTRVIVHPNFAIIYDTLDDEIKIGDLLFNTKINSTSQPIDIESTVVKQLALALEQIGKEKQIDISRLDEKQREMYAKAINSINDMDMERGVGHAR